MLKTIFQRLKSSIKRRYWPVLTELQFGREVVVSLTREYVRAHPEKTSVTVLDVGLGRAVDMLNIKSMLEEEGRTFRLLGLEAYGPNVEHAEAHGIEVFRFDLESEKMPFEDASVDIVVMNQILEHTKEWYFIFDEVARVLRKGGICIVGVPNLVSWHERVRLLFGKHPFCLDLKGAHIRGIVMKNFIEFVEQGGIFKSGKIYGTYMYGVLNPTLNKWLCRYLPTLCVTNFVVLRKEKEGRFSDILDSVFLETNFYRG